MFSDQFFRSCEYNDVINNNIAVVESIVVHKLNIAKACDSIRYRICQDIRIFKIKEDEENSDYNDMEETTVNNSNNIKMITFYCCRGHHKSDEQDSSGTVSAYYMFDLSKWFITLLSQLKQLSTLIFIDCVDSVRASLFQTIAQHYNGAIYCKSSIFTLKDIITIIEYSSNIKELVVSTPHYDSIKLLKYKRQQQQRLPQILRIINYDDVNDNAKYFSQLREVAEQ